MIFIFKRQVILAILLGISSIVTAQISFSEKAVKNTFSLTQQSTGIIYDSNDDISIAKSVELFVEDVRMVSGEKIPVLYELKALPQQIIVAGTIEKSGFIQKLIDNKKIDVSAIEGEWERYLIQVVKNPFPGVKQALVIAGSNRRAVSYGLFSISEAMGVSPWYWWADVPVKKNPQIHLQIDTHVSPAPTVKFRGIFINDEDWGLLPWAKHTFDPELKDIGPKTYAKIFELLLRLKANYLCPAMHEASGAFNKYPANKFVADSFGIVMGSVHPEPLLFNNASEWDSKTMGEWNYMTNKGGILKVLDQRVKDNSTFENVFTLALRGLHDKAMTGNYTLDERVKLVGEALKDQRAILKKYIDKPIEKIPQAFTPYKEVLDLYMAGMELPDDVILVWPDDNYGYMKQLSSPKEQKRSGGSGVYYHASYLGIPHDYLWLASTPSSLMYEELKKAYDTGADRLWLLNAGDIKSCEFPVTLFLNMAYKIHSFSFDNIADYQATWLSSIYGEKYFDEFKEITNEYFRLAFTRKPEFMGWGYEWNTFSHGRERLTDTEFSFTNYREAETRISDYERIGSAAEKILNSIPEDERPSFFQLLYYPVKGAELMNKKWLTAQKNRQYAAQGRSNTNLLRDKVKHYYDTLYFISNEYNELLDGKWKRVMSLRQGVTASYFELPKTDSVEVSGLPTLNLAVEGNDFLKGVTSYHALPAFNPYIEKDYYIDIYNTGTRTIKWSLIPSQDWIIVDKYHGEVEFEERILVSVDWEKAPIGENVRGEIVFTDGQKSDKVLLSLFNPETPKKDELKRLFIENNGVISIAGADFHRKRETDDVKIQIIENLGFEDRSVMIGDPTGKVLNPRNHNSPGVEYDFYTFHHGPVDVYTIVLPIFPLSATRDFGFHEQNTTQTRYAVCIDDGPVALPSSSSPEYTQKWYENVLRNAAINKSTLHIDKPGKHTIHIKCGDPGMVVQKIILDFGGMKKSYLGPPVSKVE